MSTLVEANGHASHHLAPEVVSRQQRRAVLFFILADAVFFACMLFAYFYLRALNVDGGWLPAKSPTAAAWQTWLISALTVLGAIVYRTARQAVESGNRAGFVSRTGLGMLLVIGAVAVTIYQLSTWKLLMSDGTYASTFSVMVWVQLVHALVLLTVAFGAWNRGRQGKLDATAGGPTHGVLVGYFWNWVALTSLLGALTTFFV